MIKRWCSTGLCAIALSAPLANGATTRDQDDGTTAVSVWPRLATLAANDFALIVHKSQQEWFRARYTGVGAPWSHLDEVVGSIFDDYSAELTSLNAYATSGSKNGTVRVRWVAEQADRRTQELFTQIRSLMTPSRGEMCVPPADLLESVSRLGADPSPQSGCFYLGQRTEPLEVLDRFLGTPAWSDYVELSSDSAARFLKDCVGWSYELHCLDAQARTRQRGLLPTSVGREEIVDRGWVELVGQAVGRADAQRRRFHLLWSILDRSTASLNEQSMESVGLHWSLRFVCDIAGEALPRKGASSVMSWSDPIAFRQALNQHRVIRNLVLALAEWKWRLLKDGQRSTGAEVPKAVRFAWREVLDGHGMLRMDGAEVLGPRHDCQWTLFVRWSPSDAFDVSKETTPGDSQ